MDKELVRKYWKQIKVGDIIRIQNNDFTPVKNIWKYFI